MAIRTEQIHLKYTETLSRACHRAKNLYNEANYVVRQWFFKTNEWIRYPTLNWLLKDVKQSPNYKNLPAQTAQQLLRLLDKNWKAFFRSIKDWKKTPSKYLGRPSLPRYRKKNGEFQLLFTNQQVRIKNGVLHLPKNLLAVRTRIAHKLKGARILPQGQGYLLELLYEQPETPLKPNQNRIASIDLGLDSLITLVNNIGEQPIVINGKRLKAVNQFFNKRKAALQSSYDKLGVKSSKKQQKMFFKRKLQVKDYIHKGSRYAVNWCERHDIDTLIVGYNPEWKQHINIGKKNNQNFVNIPFYSLIKQLEYKCQDAGIHFVLIAENYTSKCSFLDHEPIQKHKKYRGRRITRGLFQASTGTLINADVNAAYNILRKVVPNAFAEGIAGVGLHPKRIELFI
ncbi:MAG: RNA-guided endonuclease InsQ/TnpB family protein [Candidatus Heimdallarchaeota archaeon]